MSKFEDWLAELRQDLKETHEALDDGVSQKGSNTHEDAASLIVCPPESVVDLSIVPPSGQFQRESHKSPVEPLPLIFDEAVSVEDATPVNTPANASRYSSLKVVNKRMPVSSEQVEPSSPAKLDTSGYPDDFEDSVIVESPIKDAESPPLPSLFKQTRLPRLELTSLSNSLKPPLIVRPPSGPKPPKCSPRPLPSVKVTVAPVRPIHSAVTTPVSTSSDPGVLILTCPACSSLWPCRPSPGLPAASRFPSGAVSPGGRDLWKECGLGSRQVPKDREFSILAKYGHLGFDFSPILSVQSTDRPTNPSVPGIAAVLDGRPVDALTALADEPDSALRWWWTGLALIDLGRREEASHACRQSLAALPVGVFPLALHWNWASLYAGELAREKEPLHRRMLTSACLRELREVRRVACSFGNTPARGCGICARPKQIK